jgi:hypothetical protein
MKVTVLFALLAFLAFASVAQATNVTITAYDDGACKINATSHSVVLDACSLGEDSTSFNVTLNTTTSVYTLNGYNHTDCTASLGSFSGKSGACLKISDASSFIISDAVAAAALSFATFASVAVAVWSF